MTLVPGQTIVYEANIPVEHDFIVLARSKSTAFSWDNIYNQSNNLELPHDHDMFTQTGYEDGRVVGSWSVFDPDHVYTVDGGGASNVITLYFCDTYGWDNGDEDKTMSAYIWYDGRSNSQEADWPGKPATDVGLDENDKKVYSYDVDLGQYNRIIFSSNKNQTANIDISEAHDKDGFIATTVPEGKTSYSVSAYTYVPKEGGDPTPVHNPPYVMHGTDPDWEYVTLVDDTDTSQLKAQLTLAKDVFDTLVSQTAFAASTKEQRPVLTAMNLEANEGILIATATDSARMARKEVPIDGNVRFVANVPAKMMVEVDHLLEGLNSVDIAFSDKKALFTLGRTVVASRLIAGDYPNTKNIVPKMTNYHLEVNANDLIKAIDRANILSIDRENVVDLSMSDSGIEISAKSQQVGSAIERIDVFKFVGQSLKVSFNSEFVVAAVKALGSEDVMFEFVGEMKPFVVKNISDDSVIQIVTPVRTY